MELVAFIVKTGHTPLALLGIENGTHNGYVAIPNGHPCYGGDYSEEPISGLDVHGDITFSAPVTFPRSVHGRVVWEGFIGRNPILEEAEYITDRKDIPDDWWILGFDTCHFGDDKENWCMEAVVNETMRLKEQLEKLK